MPTPKPSDETKDEWMDRCIPLVLDDGTAEDSEQAVAICSSMWEQATKSGDDKMERAYSILHVKQTDEEHRIISGVATTPTPDRIGDIIEPMGVKYKNPLPLLLYHRNDKPVGTVKFNKPTKDGITFEARLPQIQTPGVLKARVDEAWDSIKTGLLKGVSIGFRSIEQSFMDDGGVRFLESEVLELSLVTVPANMEATIDTIKMIDAKFLAASGSSDPPGVPGPSVTVKSNTTEKPKMKTITEQISGFEAKRKDLQAKCDALMEKSGETGETLDSADSEEYDRMTDEIAAVDKHVDRLRKHEAAVAVTAKEIKGQDQKNGSESRGSAPRISIKEPQLPPGIAFARIVKCLGLAQGNRAVALKIAEDVYHDNGDVIDALKTAVAAGTVAGTTWAGPLVGVNTSAFADFVEYLRPQTIIGKFGANGVPALRRVPFRVGLITQTSGGEGYWVGEGDAKPLTKFDFSRTYMEPLKCANIAVLTKETIRDSNPTAETIIRDQLAAALIQRMDADFIDPDNAGTTGIKPRSISNGANTVASSGTTEAAMRVDIATLVDLWIAANNRPTSGVWVMNASTALRMGLMVNSLGQPSWPGVTMQGGNFFGMPIISTEAVGYTQDSPGEGRIVMLVNASDIYLADEGGIEVAMSEEASLSMDDAPTMTSDTPTAVSVVSMFQTNSVAFRAERTINWLRRRTESVAVLTGVAWGA
jgi:HK97 family phage prohead protease